MAMRFLFDSFIDAVYQKLSTYYCRPYIEANLPAFIYNIYLYCTYWLSAAKY